jgi:hypothetical protein
MQIGSSKQGKIRGGWHPVAALAALVPLGACEIARSIGNNDADNPGNAAVVGQSGASANGSGGAASVGQGGSNASTGAGGCNRCSQDLRSVLDCQGNVVQSCPADQGCDGKSCVSACDSAMGNKSTLGCDYYAVNPDGLKGVEGSCFAAYVANTWDSAVGINVEFGGKPLDISTFARIASQSGSEITYWPLPNGKLPVGEVAILFLSQSNSQGPNAPMVTACPSTVGVAVSGDAFVRGSGLGDAFHITTTAPVAAYDVFPYGGGQSASTSATLLRPTSSWDTNYIAINAFRKGTADVSAQPTLNIVAADDGT